MVIKTIDPKRCVLMPEYSHIQTYIICDHLFDSYKDIPKDIFICKDKELVYVARESVWGTEPWYNIDSTDAYNISKET
jgi:hypothetical protein